jgi:uncharacterized protein
MKGVRLAIGAGALALLATTAALFALPAGAETPDESRTIAVTGSGSVQVAPDRARWSFGVQTQSRSASDALAKNAVLVQKVVAAVKAAGVAPADLQTEQVSVYPQMSEDGTEIVSYTATNTVGVVVRDVAKTGAIVDAATAAGANTVSGPALTVSDSERSYEAALGKAYDQARSKAEALAASAGATLGRVLSISEGGGPQPIPFAGAAKADAGTQTPIEPGQTEISASVSVTYALS